MSTRKSTADKIEEAKVKITQYENRMKQLIQKQKAEERKARTKRLCKRAGLMESMLPDTISLTDEQFKIFLGKTAANDYGRKTLAAIIARNTAAKPTAQGAGSAAQSNPTSDAKPSHTAQGTTPLTAKPPQMSQDNGKDEDTDKRENAKVSG